MRVRSRPRRTGQRPLAGAAVGVDVAEVVDDKDRRGDQPDRDGERERLPVQVLDLDEVRAGDRDDPEEQEHEQLAEALVAVRLRAARVEHAGEDRGSADEQQLPARDGDQVRAREHRDAERRVGRDQDLARRNEATGGDPDRAEAVLGVGAAPRVGVVVRQIGADLDEHAPTSAATNRSGWNTCM